jgi:hypothetical protein
MTRTFAALVVGFSAGAFTGVAFADSHAPKLARSSIWTAYDLGSSWHLEAAGIAKAFHK